GLLPRSALRLLLCGSLDSRGLDDLSLDRCRSLDDCLGRRRLDDWLGRLNLGLVRARLLNRLVAAPRTSAPGTAALPGATPLAPPRTATWPAPALAHRPGALAVLTACAAAPAGRAETFEGAAAATPRVLVAEPVVGVAEALRHDLALVDPDLHADAA